MKIQRTFLIGILLVVISGIIVVIAIGFRSGASGAAGIQLLEEEEIRSSAPSIIETVKTLQDNLGHTNRAGHEFYDSDRDSLEDPEFARRYAEHHAIKQYLELPRREDPAYQKLLEEVYSSGYGLQHWLQAGRAIVASQIRQPAQQEYLRRKGYSEEEIAEATKLERDRWPEPKKRAAIGRVVQMTAITDETLIERLFEIPIDWDVGEIPFGLENVYSPVEGERLLSAPDWMPERIRHIVEQRGETEIQLPDAQDRLMIYHDWKVSKLNSP